MMIDNALNMEYNSQRELLIIPEYGRNVQRLILHAKSIDVSRIIKKNCGSIFLELQNMI